MKSKEYVTKYELDKDTRFDHSVFVEDLATDFKSLVEARKVSGVIAKGHFNVAIKDMHQKFNSIVKQSYPRPKETWNRLWNYFYATVVCPIRDKELDRVAVIRTGRMPCTIVQAQPKTLTETTPT